MEPITSLLANAAFGFAFVTFVFILYMGCGSFETTCFHFSILASGGIEEEGIGIAG